MSRFLAVLGLIVVLVLCAGLALPRLRSMTSDVTVPQGTATLGVVIGDSPPPTSVLPSPTLPPPTAPPTFEVEHMIFLDVPETLAVGVLEEVWVVLVGPSEIVELSFELHFPPANIQVVDANPDVEGVQVAPYLPTEDALVDVNEVTADGRVHYKVRNLGPGVELSREIFSMQLQATAATDDVIAFEFVEMTALGPGGVPLPITPQSALVQITGDGAPPPSPTPTGTPLPTTPTPVSPTPVSPTPVPPTPAEGAPGADIAPGIYCRIQPRQTLYRLAQTFGSTPEDIAAANGIADVTAIAPGTLLRIPATPPVGQAAYFVSPRETLFSIAQTFGFTVEALAAQNELAPPYRLEAGRWIVLRP